MSEGIDRVRSAIAEIGPLTFASRPGPSIVAGLAEGGLHAQIWRLELIIDAICRALDVAPPTLQRESMPRLIAKGRRQKEKRDAE